MFLLLLVYWNEHHCVTEHLYHVQIYQILNLSTCGGNEDDRPAIDAGSKAEKESDDSNSVTPSEGVGIESKRSNAVPHNAYYFERRRPFIIDLAIAGHARNTATNHAKQLNSTL